MQTAAHLVPALVRYHGSQYSCYLLATSALQVPGARLALVGDGPQRQELEQMFRGMPVKFMVRLMAWYYWWA